MATLWNITVDEHTICKYRFSDPIIHIVLYVIIKDGIQEKFDLG
jgi:hypothetical protein